MAKNVNKTVLRQPKIFQLPKDEKKSIWPKVLTLFFLMIIVVAGMIYFIFFSKFFIVKNIEMVGSQKPEIKQVFEQYKGKNLFSFNIGDLERQLEQANNNIVSLKIYRGIPDTIRVKLEDRESKIIWQTGEKKYLVDANAIAYAEVGDTADLPLVIDESALEIKIPVQIAAANFIEFVCSAQKEIQSAVQIKNFLVQETTFQVSGITDSGLKIMFSTLRPLSDQIDAFEKVYGQYKGEIKQYIDLRVEGKVYYK